MVGPAAKTAGMISEAPTAVVMVQEGETATVVEATDPRFRSTRKLANEVIWRPTYQQNRPVQLYEVIGSFMLDKTSLSSLEGEGYLSLADGDGCVSE